MILLFLSSGLFLGWSLGANDAANVFGTAVGSKMVRFRTAAAVAGLFVVVGAVVSGGGATETLGKLGAVNALAGSFVVAFSAGLTVFWMTRWKLPVSTSQAVVGAIIGWNIFSGSPTDAETLGTIVSTWVVCPVLAGAIAAVLFVGARAAVNRGLVPMLRLDSLTRAGLILVGAFGSFSLGANNIANVMGVFVPAAPFSSLRLFGIVTVSSAQILFFIGGLAIAVGIFTYSQKVMDTVGASLMKISPMAALVVVLAQAIVLFLFASARLGVWLTTHGLPAFPLVPVSSSQAVVGAVLGIGLIKGGRGIRYRVLGGIAGGWVLTPIVAGCVSLFLLFVAQNVFNQQVCQPRGADSNRVAGRPEIGFASIEYSEYNEDMKDSNRFFDDFNDRMSDRQSCVMMRDFIAHFANPIRLKLLCVLVRNERMCVNDLVEQTGGKQSTISQQLKQLQMARLVGRERQGNRVFYFIADPVVVETMQFFATISGRIGPLQNREGF